MRASDRCLELIKELEGLRLSAYRCTAGKWTIGYGHTKGVLPKDICTPDQAEAWLREDVATVEKSINSLFTTTSLRLRELNQNQYDALVSFQFNTGAIPNKAPTLMSYLYKGDYNKAGDALLAWIWETDPNTGKKRTNQGLLRRRTMERELFLRGL